VLEQVVEGGALVDSGSGSEVDRDGSSSDTDSAWVSKEAGEDLLGLPGLG
jgi:hypothetical protein